MEDNSLKINWGTGGESYTHVTSLLEVEARYIETTGYASATIKVCRSAFALDDTYDNVIAAKMFTKGTKEEKRQQVEAWVKSECRSILNALIRAGYR